MYLTSLTIRTSLRLSIIFKTAWAEYKIKTGNSCIFSCIHIWQDSNKEDSVLVDSALPFVLPVLMQRESRLIEPPQGNEQAAAIDMFLLFGLKRAHEVRVHVYSEYKAKWGLR